MGEAGLFLRRLMMLGESFHQPLLEWVGCMSNDMHRDLHPTHHFDFCKERTTLTQTLWAKGSLFGSDEKVRIGKHHGYVPGQPM